MKGKIIAVAGYDPTGGAGILADMRAFSLLEVEGYFVVTCLTFQTPDRVICIHPLNPRKIRDQIEKILEEFKPNYCKLGMIYSKDILSQISDVLEREEIRIVADPVFRASDGTMLCEEGYIEEYKRKILPISYLLIPNVYEAYKLAGTRNIRAAAQTIHEIGAENVLIKGGDLGGKNSIDTLFDGKKFFRFSLPRIGGRFHGTGCVFSSLVTANLSKGRGLRTSIDNAKRILWSMMKNSYSFGSHETRLLGKPREVDIPPKGIRGERFGVWFSLNKAVKKFVRVLPDYLIPEVGINFGYALDGAENEKDVCALVRRIDKSRLLGRLDFGTSRHISRVILTAMKFDKRVRSAVNVAYSERVILNSMRKGLKVAEFDREKEPEGVSTMEWGTRKAIEEMGEVPDMIYDRGGVGKEAMIRVLGRNPAEVVKKIITIL